MAAGQPLWRQEEGARRRNRWEPRLERIARTVIDANKYMTLATADDAGRPWASPVRLYRAKVSEHSVLVRGSDPEFGRGVDTRPVVTL
jgi:hypothetical protein